MPMQCWLLLHDRGADVGSAHSLGLYTTLGAQVTDTDDLCDEQLLLRFNNEGFRSDDDPIKVSLVRAAARAMTLLHLGFRGDARPFRRLDALNVDSRAPLHDGNSSDLVLTLATYIDYLQQLASTWREISVQPAAPFAATGTLDELGYVGAVNGLPAKLEAAMRELPAGSFVFYPGANEAQVSPQLRKQAEIRRLKLIGVDRIHKALLQLGVTVRGYWDEAPYRALQTYQVRDQPIFFGRDAQIRKFCGDFLAREARIGEGQPLRPGSLIIAPSGAGKSSFCQAGVLARLRTLPNEHYKPLEYAIWRPRQALPYAAAASTDDASALDERAIVHSLVQDWLDDTSETGGFDAIDASAHSYRELLASLDRPDSAQRRRIFVVDQLEELFTLPFKTKDDAVAFVSFLGELQKLGIGVIATLRVEFYKDYQGFKGTQDGRALLVDIFGDHKYDLPAIDSLALAQIIRGPAALAGLRFEQDADGHRLQDVLQIAALKAGSIPVIGYALEEIWKRRSGDGRPEQPTLTFKAYKDVCGIDDDDLTGTSGIQGVIGRVADEAFAMPELDQAAKQELTPLIDALTTFVPSQGKLIDRAMITSQARWRPDAPGGRLVSHLARHGLLAVETPPNATQAQVRVAHAALLEHWGKAREIVVAKQNAEAIRENKRLQRVKVLLWVAGTTAVFFLVATMFGLVQLDQANTEKRRAQAQEERAVAEQKRAETQEQRAVVGERKASVQRADAAALLANQITGKGDGMTALSALLTIAREGNGVGYTPKVESAMLTAMMSSPEVLAVAHGAPVNWVAISPDNRFMATAAANGVVKLTDLKNGFSEGTLAGHTASVATANFDKNGKRLVTASEDKTAKIWPVGPGSSAPVATLTHDHAISFAAFTGDERYIATGGTHGEVALWDATTFEAVKVRPSGIKKVLSKVHKISFSPDGAWMAVVASDMERNLELWNLRATPPGAAFILAEHAPWATDAEFTKDGKKLFTVSYAGQLRAWPLPSVYGMRELIGAPTLGRGNFVALSPDGSKYLLGSFNGRLFVGSTAKSGTASTDTYSLNSGDMTTGRFFPAQDAFFAGGSDGLAAVYIKAETGRYAQRFTFPHSGAVNHVDISPDQHWFATASADGTARLWDSQHTMAKAELAADMGRPISVTFLGKSHRVALVSAEGIALASTGINGDTLTKEGEYRIPGAKEGDTNDLVLRRDVRASALIASAMTVSLDGRTAVLEHRGESFLSLDGEKPRIINGLEMKDAVVSTATSDSSSIHAVTSTGVILTHSVATNSTRERPIAGSTGKVRMAVFSPDGMSLVFSREENGGTCVVNVGNEPLKCTELGVNDFEWASFSERGDVLALSSQGKVSIWRGRNSSEPVARIDVPSGEPLALSPSGRWLLLGAHSTSPVLFDLEPPTPTSRPLIGHVDQVKGAVFSPDEARVVTYGEDATARLWNIADPTLPVVLEHPSVIASAAFSSDSSRLVTATLFGLLLSWEVPGRDALIERAEKKTTRCLSNNQRLAFGIDPDNSVAADLIRPKGCGEVRIR